MTLSSRLLSPNSRIRVEARRQMELHRRLFEEVHGRPVADATGYESGGVEGHAEHKPLAEWMGGIGRAPSDARALLPVAGIKPGPLSYPWWNSGAFA